MAYPLVFTVKGCKLFWGGCSHLRFLSSGQSTAIIRYILQVSYTSVSCSPLMTHVAIYTPRNSVHSARTQYCFSSVFFFLEYVTAPNKSRSIYIYGLPTSREENQPNEAPRRKYRKHNELHTQLEFNSVHWDVYKVFHFFFFSPFLGALLLRGNFHFCGGSDDSTNADVHHACSRQFRTFKLEEGLDGKLVGRIRGCAGEESMVKVRYTVQCCPHATSRRFDRSMRYIFHRCGIDFFD